MGSFDCLLKVGSTKYLGQPGGGDINQTLSFLQLAPSCLQLEDQYYENLLFADSSFEGVWCESDG